MTKRAFLYSPRQDLGRVVWGFQDPLHSLITRDKDVGPALHLAECQQDGIGQRRC